MGDILDFFQQAAPPLFVETVETIMGRMIADANAGVDPTSALYLDVVPGAIPNDIFATCALEIDRVYDRMANETVRAGIPTLSQGPYLDSWAEAFDIDRKDSTAAVGALTFTGDAGTLVDVGTKASTIATVPGENAQTFQTTAGGTIDDSLGAGRGIISLAAVCIDTGAAGNVLSNTVTVMGTSIPGVESVTNPNPMSDGSDVETDVALQGRVGKAMGGTDGAGTISDYERWFLDTAGVGFATVQGQWNGPNSVRVLLTDVNNAPLSSGFIAAQQAIWDPDANGDGRGRGPVGHIITIAAPKAQQVVVNATAAFETGYSYDGTAGTIALRGPITEAVQAYLASLPAGGDVVLYKVAAAIVDVPGVANLSGLTLAAATTVTTTYVAAAATLVVASADDFSGTQVITVGGANTDTATISSVTGGNTLHLSGGALAHNHAVGDPVTGPAAAADLTVASGDVAVLARVVLS